jgi:hypothetical protein
MSDDLKKLKALDAKLEWPVRILFTIAIFLTCWYEDTCEEHYYPLNAFCLTIIALWAYFFKVRSFTTIILLLQVFLAWTHANSR